MNAGEVLEQFRIRAGFDAWIETDASGYCHPADDYNWNRDARPAWRDGTEDVLTCDGVMNYGCDKWYVLPDGWEWDDDDECFVKGVMYVMPHFRYKWLFGLDDDFEKNFDTALEAFRAAEKWLQENGGK